MEGYRALAAQIAAELTPMYVRDGTSDYFEPVDMPRVVEHIVATVLRPGAAAACLAGPAAWDERVTAVVDRAHAEDWGGKHREGFCEACADAYIVAQHAVPGGPGGSNERGD